MNSISSFHISQIRSYKGFVNSTFYSNKQEERQKLKALSIQSSLSLSRDSRPAIESLLKRKKIRQIKRLKARVKKRLSVDKPKKLNLFARSFVHKKVLLHKHVRTYWQKQKEGLKNTDRIQAGSDIQKQFSTVFEQMRTLFQPNEIEFDFSNKQESIPLQLTYSVQQISQVTTNIYSDFCQKRYKGKAPLALQKNYLNSIVMRSVILPSLFNRQVILCPPISEETDRIINKLYVDDFAFNHREDLVNIIGNQGWLEIKGQLHRVVVLYSSTADKIIGALHFKIISLVNDRFNCVIQSLKIAKKYSRMGYGKLVLAYGIKVAQEHHCESITLKSSEMAREFYLKFGFRANFEKVASLEDWNNLENTIKDEILEDCDNQMILEFCDSQVEEIVEEQLEDAFG